MVVVWRHLVPAEYEDGGVHLRAQRRDRSRAVDRAQSEHAQAMKAAASGKAPQSQTLLEITERARERIRVLREKNTRA